MLALVTGASGFIGGTLAAHLATTGWDVRGVDRRRPPARLTSVDVVHADLLTADLDALLDGVDVVFHLAGRPNVHTSWAGAFPAYLADNVEATHRLLDACRRSPVRRIVHASSSSVYGDSTGERATEDGPTAPQSPYGVTKLAAEHLGRAYAEGFGLPVVALRYFSVYGPGQRPDMAVQRIVDGALTGREFTVFGDGRQERDLTFVDDVVGATVAAATADVGAGAVINVGTGASVSLLDVVAVVEGETGCRVPLSWAERRPGDVDRTRADISRARSLLGWRPLVALSDGIAAQVRIRTDALVCE